MWDAPYLESCCRSALHRLFLAEKAGRPEGQKDDTCLRRLTDMGLAERMAEERFRLTAAGHRRHAAEVMRRPG